LTAFANFFYFFCFDGGSQLPQQILWNKFHIRCAYFTPNCTWSPNYSVLVFQLFSNFKLTFCQFNNNFFTTFLKKNLIIFF
jgi:hypothetical protein